MFLEGLLAELFGKDDMLPALKNDDKELIEFSTSYDWSIPEFKMKHFVAGAHIHPLQKIKQYMMELNSRYENLQRFETDIRRLELEVELENEMMLDSRYEAQKKLHALEIESKNKTIAISKEKLRHAAYELEKVTKLIKEFNESEEGKDPSGKLYIDIMKDPIACEEIEARYWEYRLAKQAALDMIAYGRVGIGNMEAIMQLDPDAQNKCIAMAYEVLIMNETRMNVISEQVVNRLNNGTTVSDINQRLGIENTEFFKKLLSEEKRDVPLIQKR